MARRERALTKDVTETDGTGTYTLENTSAAGYQTLAEAVARGLAANGDEVIYRVSDAASPVLYEVGRGVIGSAGLTVTRAEILERDDGSTSPKSWPSGGARNFVVTFWPGELLKGANNLSEVADADDAADNIGAARLNASNTYILQTNGIFLQDYRNTDTGSGAAAQIRTFGDVANLTIGSNSSTRTGTRFGASIASKGEVLGVGTPLNIGTTGSNNILFGTNSALVAQMTSGGVFQDAGGRKFVAFPTGGTVKILFSSAPPSGWTRVNETNQAIIRLATAADTPNASGGSDSLFDGAWSTAATALTESQTAAHTHSVPVVSGSGGSSVGLKSDGSTILPVSATGSTGSGSTHFHNMTTPYYRVACWATHD